MIEIKDFLKLKEPFMNVIKEIFNKLKHIEVCPINSGFNVVFKEVKGTREKINVTEILYYMGELDLDEETRSQISHWCYQMNQNGKSLIKIKDFITFSKTSL